MNTFLLLSALMVAQNVEVTDTLTDNFSTLDELVIVAKKEIIKSDGNTLTYNLSDDDSSKSSTLIDALKKVPMISIDGEDKIRINGDSNFKIYVNGKEDPMLEANYDKMFRSMPASSVQKIEVITEPGAKYDAEGSGGILNLITETKQKKDGYSGTISASLSNRDYFLSALGRMKYKNFLTDANISYGGDCFMKQGNTQKFTTINDASLSNHHQIENMTQSFGFSFLDASINAAWEPDDKNLFTFGGSVMKLDGKVKDIHTETSMYNNQNQLQWEYSQDLDGYLKNFSASANASYQHLFDTSGHQLTASYLFSFGRNPLFLSSRKSTNDDFPDESPYTTNYNINYNREHTFQLDYLNPFKSEKHKLETGTKIILRNNGAIGSSSLGQSLETLQPIESSLVNMKQFQEVYALYASYTGVFGNITTNAGVRYEHTEMGIKNLNEIRETIKRNLDDVVPNASVTYLFSPASNIRLAYQMKISRPSIKQMDPYQMSILGSMVQEGNPDLESEKTNKISLTYTNYARIMGGNIYLDYRFTNNAISDYVYFTGGEDESTIAHYTSANIGHNREIGLGGFYNLNVSAKMSISCSGRIAFMQLKSHSPNLKNKGWTGNYGINWNYTMPWELKLSAYGGESFGNISLQGHYSGWHYYGLSLSRNFINDALSISVSASNFLTKEMTFKSENHSGSQHNYTENKNKNWRIGINISWNFGNLKSTTKKTDITIENDDVSSSGKGNGGIGM